MLKKEVVDLLVEQVNKEFYSAYLYLAMSFYYTDKNLNGFANWFKVQAQEEQSHAMLFAEYLQNNSVRVDLPAIAAPGADFKDFKEPLTGAFEHEQLVTESIHNIYAKASEVKDFRTMQFLEWFIKEQNEEEKNADELIQKYDLFGNDSRGLYLLDQEMKTRVFSPPSLVLT